MGPAGGDYSGVVTHPLDMGPAGGGYSPPLLIPSGSHQNMYSWQVGGTHPTEYFFVVDCILVSWKKFYLFLNVLSVSFYNGLK